MSVSLPFDALLRAGLVAHFSLAGGDPLLMLGHEGRG
ncbi:hypothetical protein HD595_006531 [Nonomuraea roseoviolacea subsp. carminata]|uniref:Alpha/beta hydrolase n=1 Tax=Nonomuraea roseoviolacea subsp. carminata TaxID=160689 RepID=A0ABT1K9X6_9ACTN|nr:hypothetical protein [Nonomuraea roseoviolacea subsp. carminata]